MESEIVGGIGLIVVLGIGLQWLGRRTGIPSIVLLLAGGLIVGPGLGAVDPDVILGDALFPFVSLAVGILLFNGGLELDLAELRGEARQPVIRLVTVGALVTWVLASAAAHLVFREPARVSVLIGAILVVSGPTVVGPLLRLARPDDPSSTILRWEGILIDPIGATLGLFCLNAFFIDGFTAEAVWGELLAPAVAGALIGLAAAALLVLALRHLLVPDDLEVAVALMAVVAAYTLAEAVRPEAGLFATTAVGLAMGNQRWVPIAQLRAFGEPVVALLIGGLFIVLAAGVDADALADNLLGAVLLAAVLAVVVRPLAVAAATLGVDGVSRGHRAFLACMAPRGIVAASTAALYSLRLDDIGQPTDVLTPAVFGVILVLAVVYGVGSAPAARRLGVVRPPARGALIVSGAPWALELARELTAAGVPTVVAARGRTDLVARTDLPFLVYEGLIVDLPNSGVLDPVEGAIIASRDEETDLMALTVLTPILGRRHVWVLPSRPPGARSADGAVSTRAARRRSVEARARTPFANGVTHVSLTTAVQHGARVRTVDAAAATDTETGAVPLIRLTGHHWTASIDGDVEPGDRLIVAEGVDIPGEALRQGPDG